MTENYLYFGEGGGANATTEAGCFACSKLTGVSPIIKTTTGVYFEGTTNAQDAGELVTLTHSSNISGEGRSTGHTVRDIANAIAAACNATPKGQFITIADMDESIMTDRFHPLMPGLNHLETEPWGHSTKKLGPNVADLVSGVEITLDS